MQGQQLHLQGLHQNAAAVPGEATEHCSHGLCHNVCGSMGLTTQPQLPQRIASSSRSFSQPPQSSRIRVVEADAADLREQPSPSVARAPRKVPAAGHAQLRPGGRGCIRPATPRLPQAIPQLVPFVRPTCLRYGLPTPARIYTCKQHIDLHWHLPRSEQKQAQCLQFSQSRIVQDPGMAKEKRLCGNYCGKPQRDGFVFECERRRFVHHEVYWRVPSGGLSSSPSCENKFNRNRSCRCPTSASGR